MSSSFVRSGAWALIVLLSVSTASAAEKPSVYKYYAQQYEGVSKDKLQTLITLFASIELNVDGFKWLRKKGLSPTEILGAAIDVSEMGMKGKTSVEDAHYTFPEVKEHLKRAHKALLSGDRETAEREVEAAERANR